MIARWFGTIQPGQVSAAMVSNINLLPTLIEIAGGEAPTDLDGHSFKQVLLGQSSNHRRQIYTVHNRDGEMNVFPQRGLRDHRYQYVLNLNSKDKFTTYFTKVEGIPERHGEVWNSWIEKARTDANTIDLIDLIENHPAEELFDLEIDPYQVQQLSRPTGSS